MKYFIFLLSILIVVSSQTYGQSITHPLWVIDRGGGKSTADTFALHASIGQSAIQMMTVDTLTLESGFIPELRRASGVYTTHEFSLSGGWNLISIPLRVNDYSKNTLFSTATSKAFSYNGFYLIKDTLRNGYGYWLKFSGSQTNSIVGSSYTSDTIDVIHGWNMIGSLTYPILTTDVTPIPPVTIISNFFYYDAGYHTEDTLKPGIGYWIKTSEAGKIILKNNTLIMTNSKAGRK